MEKIINLEVCEYKSIRRFFVLAISIALSSCLQKLDNAPRSFVRVYGSEGYSLVSGMTKLENGNLLLCGDEIKPRFLDGSDVDISFLIEIDEFGNQVRYRNFMFYQGEFEIRFAGVDSLLPGYYGTDEFKTIYSWIEKVIQLRDGNFFCIGFFGLRPDNPSWPEGNSQLENFYLLLDKDLEPIEWGVFDDTELEGPPQYFSGVNGYNIYELPSGEIVFSTYYHEYDANFTIINRGFTIMKYTRGKGLSELYRVASGSGNLFMQARGFVLSPDGSSVVVAVVQAPVGYTIGEGEFASFAQTSVFQLDISSGAVLNSKIYYTRGISYNLVNSDNGYVMQVYHPDPGDDLDQDTRRWWGSLLFIDEELDSLELKNITETKNVLLGNRRIIRTRDGGYVTEFVKNADYGFAAVLIKTDANGKVLWRHEEGPDTQIKDILEMDDGGIAFVVDRKYNGIGFRTTLVKLTADGKL